MWLALAVLAGWNAGHGVIRLLDLLRAGDGHGMREVLSLILAMACAAALLLGVIRERRGRRPRASPEASRHARRTRGARVRGRVAVVLGAWFLLGMLAGVRGTPDPPPIDAAARKLPPTGVRSWLLLTVDSVEEGGDVARWKGRLQAWAAGEGWIRLPRPERLGGFWNGAARGRFLVLATVQPGAAPADPLRVRVERAWSVRDEDARPAADTPAARAARWRARLAARVCDVLGEDAGTLAARTFLGPGIPAPKGWDDPFRRTGTMHLLSISGFHFSLLGGVLLLGARVALRGARWARWLAIALLGAYGWFVGAPAPVLRSWGGALLLAAGPAWGRPGRTVNALGLTAALLPLLDPASPLGPSFVMSYAATAGVILGGRAAAIWEERVRTRARGAATGSHRAARGKGKSKGARPALVRALWLAGGASVGATLLTAAWSFHWFGPFYPLGVLANLVAIPAMAIVMAVQVPALLVIAAGAGAAFPYCVIGRLAGESFLAILRVMATTTGSWVCAASMDRVTALAWTVVAGLGLLVLGRWGAGAGAGLHGAPCKVHPRDGTGERDPDLARANEDRTAPATRRKWNRHAVARGCAWALLVAAPLAAGEARRVRADAPFRAAELELRFLDVGQGDATLIRAAGTTWLVDLGIGSLHGRDRLVPQLLRAGVRRVDRCWLTHGDADHWGGLVDLLASPVRVDTLVLAEGTSPPAGLVEALRAQRRPPVITRAAAGCVCRRRGITTRVIHPPAGFRAEETNAGSLVLVLESALRPGLPPFRVLLPGDLPRGEEEATLASGGPGAVLVAELAHHGSRSAGSWSWWEATRPSLGVISVGRGNSYGLPHPATLEEAERRGVRILRTDRDGAIRVAFGSRGVQVARAGPS